MKASKAASVNHQHLVLLLVTVAVIIILGSKFARSMRAISVPPNKDAFPTTPPSASNVLPEEGDPFPSKSAPSAQVEWVLRHHKPAMILFHSTLCRPCMMMDALMQMVRPDYEPAVVFIEVIIDDPANAELIRQARVGSIPAALFVDRSGQVKRVIGLMKQQDLRAELARLASEQ